MFGIVLSGRLVQTQFEQVSDHKVVFNIEDITNANHIVVFMTGQTPFPDRMGGAVYFCMPNPAGETWYFLGVISNTKPSAIFKITNLKKEGDTCIFNGAQNPFQASASQPHIAKLGISAEPMDQLMQMTPTESANTSTLDTFVEFSTKSLEKLFNYVSSFAVTPAQMNASHATQTFVPLASLQTWYETFQRRLQVDPYFWRK